MQTSSKQLHGEIILQTPFTFFFFIEKNILKSNIVLHLGLDTHALFSPDVEFGTICRAI